MRLSIVIPTYNSATRTVATLRTIARQEVDLRQVEVVVSDDGSSDGTKAILDRHAPDLPCLQYVFRARDADSGRSSARNVGIRASSGDRVLFVDSGVLLGPGFLGAVLDARPDHCVAYKTLGLFAGPSAKPVEPFELLHNVSALEAHWAYRDLRELHMRSWDRPDLLPAPWTLAWTCALSAPMADVRDEPFDVDFRGWGAEDIDLAFRLARRGLKISWRDDVFAVHLPHDRESNEARSHNSNAALVHAKYATRDTELFTLWRDGISVNIFAARLNRLVLPALAARCRFTNDEIRLGSVERRLVAGVRSSELDGVASDVVLAHEEGEAQRLRDRFPDAEVRCFLGVSLPYATNTFDQAVLGDLYRLFPRDVQMAVFREMGRVARNVTLVVGTRRGPEHRYRGFTGWGWSSFGELSQTLRWAGLEPRGNSRIGDGYVLHAVLPDMWKSAVTPSRTETHASEDPRILGPTGASTETKIDMSGRGDTTHSDDLARQIVELADIGSDFDSLANSIVHGIRTAIGVVEPGAEGLVDDGIEDEFQAARNRLDVYRSEFRDLHAALLAQHFGREFLPDLRNLLQHDVIQRYFKSRVAMQSQLRAFIGMLARRMRHAALHIREDNVGETND